MPIIEFSTNQQLENWMDKCACPEKYRIFVTSQREVVVRPTKSTDTLDFGYIKFLTIEKLEGTVAKLAERGYEVLEIANFYWDKEKFANTAR